MLSLNLWHEGVLAPIDTNNPVGTNIRLDNSFDCLQQEVSNDLAMDREATDWNKVLNLSSDILTKQSKDLLVLVYSIRAIMFAHRYEGLARAITFLPFYIERYWENGFPLLKRKRARLGAIEWLTQQLELWVETNEPLMEERLHLESAISGIKLLNSTLSEYGEEWCLDLFSTTRKLDSYLMGLSIDGVSTAEMQPQPQPQSQPQSHHKPTVQLATRPQQKTNEQFEIVDEKTFQSGIRDVRGSLKTLAEYRLSQNIYDPRAYEINRFSTWLPISELPAHQENITPLRPVPLEKRQTFETLYQQKHYETLIKEVEGSLTSSPFWLDGHRIVVESLTAMGGAENKPYQKAIHSISGQVKTFISRLEGIECLSFSDGTPFADADTLSWIAGFDLDNPYLDNPCTSKKGMQDAEITFVRKPINVESESSYEDAHQDGQSILAEANALLRDQDFSVGLSKLDDYCKDRNSKNEWFRARLLMAQYCLSEKEYVIAEQLLLELDELSLRHQLDSWEPEISVELLSMMLICKNKLKRKQENSIYFSRLSQLSVMQAFEIKKNIF